ncbi:MAG: hypothetical protein PHE09_01170 [Oscillospiraceae bacterium]|nr:hypothetical protein [Oscillospiraceae bacterium]
MENQKRFQKKTLNSDDHKGMEHGAVALKYIGGFGLGALLIKNKTVLKKLGSHAVDIATKAIKR